jgi:hypothetical protein
MAETRRRYVRRRPRTSTNEAVPEPVTDIPPYTIMPSIPADKAPMNERKKPGGIWISLAKRMVADYRKGLVTVVCLPTRKDMERCRTGVRLPVGKIDNTLQLVSTAREKDGQWELYLRLMKRET